MECLCVLDLHECCSSVITIIRYVSHELVVIVHLPYWRMRCLYSRVLQRAHNDNDESGMLPNLFSLYTFHESHNNFLTAIRVYICVPLCHDQVLECRQHGSARVHTHARASVCLCGCRGVFVRVCDCSQLISPILKSVCARTHARSFLFVDLAEAPTTDSSVATFLHELLLMMITIIVATTRSRNET
jgi:hypothetical protein